MRLVPAVVCLHLWRQSDGSTPADCQRSSASLHIPARCFFFTPGVCPQRSEGHTGSEQQQQQQRRRKLTNRLIRCNCCEASERFYVMRFLVKNILMGCFFSFCPTGVSEQTGVNFLLTLPSFIHSTFEATLFFQH